MMLVIIITVAIRKEIHRVCAEVDCNILLFKETGVILDNEY
jgi:hypothetical protein